MAAVPAVGETLGRFRIVEQLGQGGMGVVFRAFDTQLQRYVALKFTTQLADEARQSRFRTEALALARLNHPHIGVIHGFEHIAGRDVLVMEHVVGTTLADHIAGRPLPQSDVIRLGLQLSAALREAHASGVIHRDLKPNNIMITKDGDAKVLDFGLALLRVENSPTVSAVKLEGTVQYLAPEVLKGGIPDERSDVFSLGAVLYEMATGRPPHAKDSFAKTVESVLHGEPVPPEKIVSGISPSLSGIIKKALASDVKNRYQTAGEVRDDLLRLQSGTAIELPPMFWPKRRRLKIGLMVALPLLAALLLWIGTRMRTPPIPEKRVIAVLPFEPIGGAPEDRALSRGLTDLLTVRLAQVSRRYNFEVVPASEVRAQEISSAEQARHKLGASLVVEGSWDFGNRGRIMYALVDPATRRNLDAAVVRADTADIGNAENDVYQQLLGMLNVELGSEKQLKTDSSTAPSKAYQYYVRGRGYLWDYQDPQNLNHAIALFQSAIDADPKFASAYAALGEAFWRRYEETKDPQWATEAITACDRAKELNPELSSVHTTLGLIYHGTGKDSEAVKSFEEALRLEATNDTASRGLGATYQSLGKFKQAEETYRHAIEIRPDYWGGYLDLGIFFYKRGQLDQAAEQFRKVIQLVPDNVRAYADLGGIYYLQNKYDDARKMYEQSLKIQPNYRAYSNLGTLEFFQKRYPEAAQNFELALKINAQDGRIWRNLGASYYWAGQKDKATEAYLAAAERFEKQLTVNPNDSNIKILLADCYAMAGEKQRAERLVGSALNAGTEDAEIAFRAAGIYEHLGDREKALNWLATALSRGQSVKEVETDPTFADLRKDPRFTALQNQK